VADSVAVELHTQARTARNGCERRLQGEWFREQIVLANQAAEYI
jgi:hypothetical protein